VKHNSESISIFIHWDEESKKKQSRRLIATLSLLTNTCSFALFTILSTTHSHILFDSTDWCWLLRAIRQSMKKNPKANGIHNSPSSLPPHHARHRTTPQQIHSQCCMCCPNSINYSFPIRFYSSSSSSSSSFFLSVSTFTGSFHFFLTDALFCSVFFSYIDKTRSDEINLE
jgi:hypothetical protein